MPSWLAGRVDPAVTALRTALAEVALRRLIVSWFAVNAGQSALLVTILVIAYNEGGPVAVGFFSLARYLTPAIVAPFVGIPAARWPTESVLRWTNTTRTLAVIVMAGLVAVGAPIWLLALVVAVEAGAGAFSRPLQMSLLPAVAQTPEQLIAANVTSGAAEGLGVFVGPALTGLLLVIYGPLAALLAVVAIYAIGVASIAGLHVQHMGQRGRPEDSAAALAALSVGVRTILSTADIALVISSLGLQTFVRGLLNVLTVVAAIELLGMGEPGVGTLNAAIGLGGLAGAIAAISLAGRRRLGGPFAVALAGWGAPIAIMGIVANAPVAIACMAAVGISNAVLDVAGFTLLQRLSPNAARVAVFGVMDSAANAGPAIGGLVAPVLIGALGIQGALVVSGAILPVAALVASPRLRRVGEASPEAARREELVRGQSLFAPLSLATVEHLASSLVPITAEAGAWLMREGESGNEYLLIESGEAEVSRFGEVIATLGPGDGVGEIALLRAVPRTASVRALTEVGALSLDCGSFLEAVTGQPASYDTAERIARGRLAADSERDA
jgi:Cyclic nucleotide-binding domain